jgi:predicted small lipoprotein YifL
MKIHKALCLLLGLSILAAAPAGCGRKGDLVLPDEAQKTQSQKPQSQEPQAQTPQAQTPQAQTPPVEKTATTPGGQ